MEYNRELFSRKLTQELKRLQRLLNYGHYLKVRWIPGNIKHSSVNKAQRLSGEVLGETIYIYEEDEDEALITLRHEVIEHLLFNFEKNYVEFINSLIKIFNEIQGRKREALVEKIMNAL